MQRQQSLIVLILVLVMAAILVIVRIPAKLGLDLQGGSQLTLQVKPTEDVKEIDTRVMEAVQKVVEGRINGLGVSEAVVQTVGQSQLIIQLPGVNDPQQAERVLGGTAQLEFRKQRPGSEGQFFAEFQVRLELRRQQEQLLAEQQQLRKSDDEAAIAKNKAAIDENKAAIKRNNEALLGLFDRTGLTGKNLKDADARATSTTVWEVTLAFDPKGGDLFAQMTKDLAGTGRSIGIFLDDGLLSAPTVGPEFAQSGILGGNAVITGNFSAETANELAIQLRGGALPVPVEIIENRTVGASLGKDSIQRSIYAAIGGLVLVLIFMAVYYRLPGMIADLSLVIYAILTFAAFSLLGVTLTLPGIAGFILSIGMAVDANVLIFERTREELRTGKTLYRSVESGFYRAFSSILDSNVTTLIACSVLFYLGAGLVKGFALTLGLGVVISMFTALTCSRTLLLLALGFPGLRKPELYCPNLPPSSRSSAGATS
ncbi:protein-export membrane protein SecD [Leptolyngbya sp. 'hensonii']|uniref:protein translocase subunit SecD n=1 Tax=Leptolyngbya sp. 'hensonii' TaxID=1922337 RepID=UPI00094F948E|nr:protein translocase subunit SecD [Leptolyngbya sp. 'hensonii']OLP19984.1 protein-export membrane protein SecD [Leptolyngbya sp. 'hensonii']